MSHINKMANQIKTLIGGESNIQAITHCSTRLRINVKDNKLVKLAEIKKIEGVVDALFSNGQLQIIIGTEVPKVYDAFMSELSGKTSQKEDKPAKDKEGFFSRIIDFISSSFTPILPAIIGGGLLKGIIAIFVAFNWLSEKSIDYQVLSLIADASFQFLPVLLAYTSAKKLKANPYISVTLAGILLSPAFLSMVNNQNKITLFGLPIRSVNYTSSVIPILLIVYVQAKIEKFLNQKLPSTIGMFLTPTISIFVNAVLGLIILGPLGAYVGDYLGMAIGFMNSHIPWLAPTILGAFSPVFVMLGVHYSLFPIALQSISRFGYDSLLTPSGLVANMAQAGAGFGVAIRTKNQKLKSTAYSTSVTALLGITEPVLYSVNLKLKKPLYAAIIGGGVGGLYAGLTFVTATAMASPGILALALFAKTLRNLLNAVIAMVISFTVSFVLSLLLVRTDKQKKKSKSGKSKTLVSATDGKIVPLADVNDSLFSTEKMGKGIAINSTNGDIYAPIAGTITAVFPSKHAYGIKTADNLEVLIHLGIDTVELKGKYFTSFVKQGQEVEQGQKIAHFEPDSIEKAGYDPVVIIVITNDQGQIPQICVTANQEVTKETRIIKLERK